MYPVGTIFCSLVACEGLLQIIDSSRDMHAEKLRVYVVWYKDALESARGETDVHH